MPNAALLATRYARRPLLLEPSAARELVQHLTASDPRGLRRESRLDAVLRKVGIGRGRPVAMDQDDEASAPSPARPDAYAPLWAQQRYGEPTDEGFAWTLYEGAALMEVDTAIGERGEYYCGAWYHGYDTILAAFREALADQRVGGLFVRMSSPGGVVAGGLPTLAAFMRNARATGNAAGKPIHVYADLAASAAYWIAAQADRISAPGVGLVGSIGAVLVHTEVSGALAEAGVTVTPIQFGAEKTAGNNWEPLSASAKADLQAEIDQCGHDFVADVAAGRPRLTLDALIATQARVFMARHADPTRSGLALGFVDAIETEEQAFEALLSAIRPSAAAADPTSPANPPQEPRMAARPALNAPSAPLRAAASRIAAGDAPPAGSEAAGEGELEPGPAEGDEEEVDELPPIDEPAPSEPETTSATAARAEILASAEAETHPAAALAAIRSGMTLAQLRGQLAAAPARGGALRTALAGAPRLGPDGAKAGGSRPGGLVASAQRLADARRAGR